MSPNSISVVIPAYNAEATIQEALDSVAQQRYDVLETIVVDDGSVDNTAGIVEQNYPQVKVIRVTNGGPSRARNIGAGHAHGEWLAFLDADDVWHPDKLWHQMAVGDRVGADLIATDWIRGVRFPSIPEPLPYSMISYRDMLILNRFQTSTVLMRRPLFDALGGFDSDVDGAEDWDLWLRAAARGRIVKIDWPLVRYRDVDTGYSKDVWRVYRTMQPMLEKHRHVGVVTPRVFYTIESWHHLRFWVAFQLAHDAEHARQSWKNAVQPRLWPYLLPAGVQYLVPFLWQRVRRSKTFSTRQRQ